jgi:Fe-S cluster assembly protein SufD
MSTVVANSTLNADAIKSRAASSNEPAFLTDRRLRALDHYMKTPMPGRTDEVWRRVEFGKIDFEAAAQRSPFESLATLANLPAQAKSKNVFWGTPEAAAKEHAGLLEKHWSTEIFPSGVEGPNGVHGSGGKFHSLNQALWEGGYVLHVPKGVDVEMPFTATFRTRPGSDGIFPHNLIVIEEGASATVIEEYVPGSDGVQNGLCNPQTEIVLQRGAKLRYILLQTTGPEVVYFGAHRSHQYADSRLTNVSAHLGSRLAKAFIATKMLEPGGHAYLSGLYYGTGTQKIHMDTYQHHVAPNCTTDLMFKGALDNTARAVYRGMIRLEPGAQKTDAYQQNRTLLLSDDARVDAIPGLEILANDVRCTHGATAGQIDPTILFYLMSRGITNFQAKKMIMDGFFEEVMLRFGLESVVEPLRKRIDGKIGDR